MYAKDIDISFYNKSGKLRLVKPDTGHADITIKWLRHNNVTKYLGADFSKMTINDEIDHLKNMVEDGNRYSWMIEFNCEIVGNVEINEIAELSEKYKVKAGAFCTLIGDKDNWGKGLSVCSKQAACNWAFSEGGFELLEAKAYVQNWRSWKALESLGFNYQGIENGDVEGSPVEWKAYTLTKKEWEVLNWPTTSAK